jgi:FkbM family methyltransferase
LVRTFHLKAITQPYYLLRPNQVLRRLRFWYRRPQGADSSVALPWGLSIRCRPNDDIGYSLHTIGIYDLLLTEMICRCVERGETVIDAGANIGYATSLMAMLAGPGGRVYAFEPHPQIFLELGENVESWLRDPRMGAVELLQSALSESTGTATLREPSGFEANRGTASLAGMAGVCDKAYTVKTQRLDEIISPQGAPIGVWKIDVEGQELAAFQGAQFLLRSHRIRDIIFEEFSPYPAATHRFLEGCGYSTLHFERGLLGPTLWRTGAGYRPPRDSPPNFLATLDPARMADKFRARRWDWLSAGRRTWRAPGAPYHALRS